MKNPLTIDEVLALQYFGMENSEILKMQLNTFEKLLDENPILEEYLDKANSVLDRQEAAGVISYVWTDPSSSLNVLKRVEAFTPCALPTNMGRKPSPSNSQFRQPQTLATLISLPNHLLILTIPLSIRYY